MKMDFLPKIIVFITGIHIISAKSYFDYHEYQPFHIPWAIKYPQPLISIDGVWPIGYPYQVSRDEYPYHDDTYQQELLTKSLNRALIKLNLLLPPSILSIQETMPFLPSTKPEVVAEALNRAIDRLSVFLKKPVNINPYITSTEIPKQNFMPLLTNLPIGDVVNKNQVTSTTEVPQQSTITSENIPGSVSGAIEKLDKLFATLPDELKAKPTKLPVRNNNNGIVQNRPSNSETFINVPMFIPDNKPPNNLMEILSENPNQPITTEDTLFTSHPLVVKHKDKIEVLNNNIDLFTSIPYVPGSSVISTSTQIPDVNNLFTSFELTGLTGFDITTVSPNENNIITSALPTENDATTAALPSEKDVNTSALPTENDVITLPSILPTEINVVTSVSSENMINTTEKNIETRVSIENESSENIIQSYDLPVKDADSIVTTIRNDVSTTTEIIPMIDIRFGEDKSDSIIFPDQFEEIVGQNKEPNKQEIDLENRFGESSTQISLEYKPSRPPYHPGIFPPIPIPQTNPNLQTISEQKPVENNQNLEYNPDVFPQHILPPLPQTPQTDSNVQTSNFELGDRNKPISVFSEQNPVITENPQINLEYKPSRPPFHSDVFPPLPMGRPQTNPNLQNFELGDKNKPISVFPEQNPVNTENPQINLEYKPSRPPFHADVFPPLPTGRPQTDPNLQNFDLGDRNKPISVFPDQNPVITENPQIILEYKPSRPPFHADVFPPLPTGRPQTDPNLQTGTNFELGDRNKPGNVFNGQNLPQTQTPFPVTTTTQRIVTTTKNNEPYHPTHYYSTPISLEYKPTRPFYAPNPIVYPKPIIRPGTPWPAVSTERPTS